MTRIRNRLTYANVVATLSLFLVLAGGTAVAAGGLGKDTVGTKQLKKNAVTTAKIKNGAVTGAKVQTATLGTVPSATSADSAKNATHAATADKATTATTATTANSATTATTAGNALSLGGIPASGYTRSDCASVSGQVKGFAYIDGPAASTAGLSTTGVGLAYNCSGGVVEVEGLGGGAFRVVFVGSPMILAVASSTDTLSSGNQHAATVSVRALAPGVFEVETFDVETNSYYNGSFSLLAP